LRIEELVSALSYLKYLKSILKNKQMFVRIKDKEEIWERK